METSYATQRTAKAANCLTLHLSQYGHKKKTLKVNFKQKNMKQGNYSHLFPYLSVHA